MKFDVHNLDKLVKNFKAGQVAQCYQEWLKYTTDPEILQIVKGDVISFTDSPPYNSTVRPCNASRETRLSMEKEIKNMLITVSRSPVTYCLESYSLGCSFSHSA